MALMKYREVEKQAWMKGEMGLGNRPMWVRGCFGCEMSAKVSAVCGTWWPE